MKRILFIIVVLCFSISAFAQKEWHVTTTGTPEGNGSLSSPWDLQTALSHPASVLPGDTIWLHGGTYKGHFTSVLNGTADKYITVRGVKGEGIVELDGNTESSNGYILTIPDNSNKQNVIFRDFEITMKGDFDRLNLSSNNVVSGIFTKAPNCKFINIIIHNVTGVWVGSSEQSINNEFYGIITYNNGWYEITNNDNVNCSKSFNPRGGVFYMKNSKEFSNFNNNIVFNNLRAGIELWSASSHGTEWDENRSMNEKIILKNNIIFNINSPLSYHLDWEDSECKRPQPGDIKGLGYGGGIIIATDDKNGRNIAKDIEFSENILYNNTDFNLGGNSQGKIAKIKVPLALGSTMESPVERIHLSNNLIIGAQEPIRLDFVKSLYMRNNLIFGRQISINNVNINNNWIQDWDIDENHYFYKSGIDPNSLGNWDYWKNLNFDMNGSLSDYSSYVPSTNRVQQNKYEPNRFSITIMNKNGGVDTDVDFSRYGIPTGTPYTVRDVENYHTILRESILNGNSITITQADMDNPNFEKFTNYADPSHDRARKSKNNFGVFIIDFAPVCSVSENLTVENVTLNSTEEYKASNIITVGGGVIANTTANIVAEAGKQIVINKKTLIKRGSKFHASIKTPTCQSLTYVGEEIFNPVAGNSSGRKVEDVEQSISSFEIAPVPADDFVKVSSDNAISSIKLYDLSGKQILAQNNLTDTSVILDVKSLEQGIYLIYVEMSNGEVQSRRIIKN
ncbi:MAG: T9SS type A sorting domain-containing protein [Flavobacteriales bacterium]|nr:T9SS type A sorting domain-containing protein [Flavobacteriales bacterium]